MYINSDAIENFSESLVKRDELLNDNDTSVIATRVSTIIVIISWYVYGKYALLCLRGIIRHKNYNFLFPLEATLFAFVNNSNDIFNYIYHQSDCYPFWLIFVASASLNWAPISWLQAYRLAMISKIYLPKVTSYIIITLAVTLSSIYCIYYFLNLSLFDYTKNETIGCAVTNPGKWTPYIMVSDIVDSVFSLASLCIIVFKTINHLIELNSRNERLNDLVGQGVIELFIIALAKIIIYPLIHFTSSIPGLDVFWDILSMIVIISAYNLVNFPYEHSINKSRTNIRRNVFNFIDSNIGSCSRNESSSNSINNAKYIKTPDSDSDDYKSSTKKESYINPPTYSYSGVPNFGVQNNISASHNNSYKNYNKKSYDYDTSVNKKGFNL